LLPIFILAIIGGLKLKKNCDKCGKEYQFDAVEEFKKFGFKEKIQFGIIAVLMPRDFWKKLTDYLDKITEGKNTCSNCWQEIINSRPEIDGELNKIIHDSFYGSLELKET
jgi:hypothetical protein